MKPFLTYDEQIELLVSRGLEGVQGDESDLRQKLQSVGYYRLSGYMYPFRVTLKDNDRPIKSEVFKKGTNMTMVWEYYLFDRRLRLLIADAIERVEIALRVAIAYEWAKHSQCPNPQKSIQQYAKNYKNKARQERLKAFQECYLRSKEDCATHFKKQQIDNVEDLPVWVMVQFSTLGALHNLLANGLKKKVRESIAVSFGFKAEEYLYFTSLISLFNVTRNACAHHGRMWNRSWTQKNGTPIIQKAPANQKAAYLTSTAYLLTSLRQILQHIAPNSKWHERQQRLLTIDIPTESILQEIGFPKR